VNPNVKTVLINGTIVVLVVLALAAIGFSLYRLVKDTSIARSDTVQQALWLSLSVVLLLLVLLAFAIIFKILDVTDKSALGLPEGSISAVIALMLLFLFSLSSVYLYIGIRNAETSGVDSIGLTAADVQRLPDDRILRIQRTGEGANASYTATLTSANSVSTEVGRTTLATISTLLVAIVGFYFGQRSSERGFKQAIDKMAEAQTQAQPTSKRP
jgi:hypothetical protein